MPDMQPIERNNAPFKLKIVHVYDILTSWKTYAMNWPGCEDTVLVWYKLSKFEKHGRDGEV